MTAQADIRTKRRVAALSAGLAAVVLLMGVSSGMALAKSAKKTTTRKAAAKVVVSVDHTQFAYKLDVFTGKGYAENFVPQAEKSMRVVANVGNVIMPKTADVQWSESDGQWVADWENYDHPSQDVGDIMQVLQGGKVITTVRKVTVAIYYPDTSAQDQSTLLTGKSAQDALNRSPSTRTSTGTPPLRTRTRRRWPTMPW